MFIAVASVGGYHQANPRQHGGKQRFMAECEHHLADKRRYSETFGPTIDSHVLALVATYAMTSKKATSSNI